MSTLLIGTAAELAAIPKAGILNDDVSYIWLNRANRVMIYDSAETHATDTTNHPYYIRPDDYGAGPGVWVEAVGENIPQVWNAEQTATGRLLSKNWGPTSGAGYNLDLATFQLGGSNVNAAGVSSGIFMGLHDGEYKFYVGDGSEKYIKFDATNFYINLSSITLDSSVPKLALSDGVYDRVVIGKIVDTYTLQVNDAAGNLLFDISSNQPVPYLKDYADSKAIELELMKINFQNISWAQFAIYDAFDDETKRLDPDTSTYEALVERSQLIQGDATPGKAFGFISKLYENITTIETGTSTSVGLNFLTDTNKSWFTDEPRGLTLKDSADSTFTVLSATSNTLTISGTPAAGAYSLIDGLPSYAVAFCSLSDSANGGSGSIKMEVSFDNGANAQVFYETGVTDLRQGTVAITNPGTDYIVRFTLTNDGSGNGPIVYKFLVCTDPSCWRF